MLNLAPGSVAEKHMDPTLALEIHKSVIRLTIPIFYTNQVEFFLNGIPVPMKQGECWYLKLSDPHKVTNLGETARVNLTIDMIPNTWVRKRIEDNRLKKN